MLVKYYTHTHTHPNAKAGNEHFTNVKRNTLIDLQKPDPSVSLKGRMLSPSTRRKCPEQIKCIGTEAVVAGGSGRGGTGSCSLHRVSVWGDENILEMDGGDGGTTWA